MLVSITQFSSFTHVQEYDQNLSNSVSSDIKMKTVLKLNMNIKSGYKSQKTVSLA